MNSNYQIITDKYEMHEIAKTLLKFQPKETIKITL